QLSSKDRRITRQPIFYAESWALVHMLFVSPRWQEGMLRYPLLLEKSTPDDAFREAFGKTFEQALVSLQSYVKVMKSWTEDLGEAPALPAMSVTALSPIAAAVARAELALHV